MHPASDSAQDKDLFADLILPLPLPGTYTYSVPAHLRADLSVGRRVLVQFGKKELCMAVVTKLHNNSPTGFTTKEIISVLDKSTLVLPVQIRFWEWIASYYMCSVGEVMKAALPSGLKPNTSSGSTEITYKPKTTLFLSLHPQISNSTVLDKISAGLQKTPKQLKLLSHYLRLSNITDFSNPHPQFEKITLIKETGVSDSVLKALVKKNIFLQTRQQVSRITGNLPLQQEISILNTFQQEALESISKQLNTKEVVLLNGITSGGKTEIYIHLIKEQLKKKRQVLYLLPEIALTTQIITRLKSIFGESAGVYHSKFSDSERVEIWNTVLENSDKSFRLILGARSSLFLPFSRLGLVIVDEEHENTYKQFDPAPRYNARDAAIMLASMHGAKTVLGTATPSVESWYNALSGKYGLVNLLKRYKEIQLPEIVIGNTREARKKKRMKSLFTPELLDATSEALSNNEQVILFQNRRGYAPYLECFDCGWIPSCSHCDVSMTYHKNNNKLLCHYCGFSSCPAVKCPDCGSEKIQTRGFGTEKIEDEIAIFFPGVKTGRLDQDSVKRKRAHEEIISQFESGDLDILTGTQMVAKGLDFGKVSLVGILNADNLLFFPDFRAHERSFQLISQVSGRAGRKTKRGKVVIQTGFPDHPVIKHVLNNNFQKHLHEQLTERKAFLYPPFVRLIRITVKDKNKTTAEKAAEKLAEILRIKFRSRVLGPEFPVVGRIQNRFIMNILLKIDRGAKLPVVKSHIIEAISGVKSNTLFKSCQIYPDVDPV